MSSFYLSRFFFHSSPPHFTSFLFSSLIFSFSFLNNSVPKPLGGTNSRCLWWKEGHHGTEWGIRVQVGGGGIFIGGCHCDHIIIQSRREVALHTLLEPKEGKEGTHSGHWNQQGTHSGHWNQIWEHPCTSFLARRVA